MFTHSAVNFTWHQLSEHTLLHDLYPSKRKTRGPPFVTVMYFTLLSVPSWLPLSYPLCSDVLILSVFHAMLNREREKKKTWLIFHMTSKDSQTTDWFCFLFKDGGGPREGSGGRSLITLSPVSTRDFKHAPPPCLVLIEPFRMADNDALHKRNRIHGSWG